MKLLLLLAAISPALSQSTTVGCVLGGWPPCPTGSACSTTITCRGQCNPIWTPPPVIPCTVGNNAPCPTGSTCTRTGSTFCPPTATTCRGQCIATPRPPIPCTMGNNAPCPASSTCTPTMFCPPTPAPCGGLCIYAPTPLPVTSCNVGGVDVCGKHAMCSQTMTCLGLCKATPKSLSSHSASHSPSARLCGAHYQKCPPESRCVISPGQICGPDVECHGVCIPMHHS